MAISPPHTGGASHFLAAVLSARKPCAGQLEAFHQARDRLKKVATTLETKQQEAQTRLADIETQVAVIDANRIALTAMQRSAEAMGEDNGSLAKGLDRLQEKVHSLFADVETELRIEDDRWAADATKEINSVDSVGSTLVAELEELCQQIANTKNEVGLVETAVERAQSRHRTVERQALVNRKLTDEEYERMSAANHTLEDERRQTPDSEIRRDKLLNELFTEEK